MTHVTERAGSPQTLVCTKTQSSYERSRKQYEVVADVEAFLRQKGSPDNFMIIGSGGKEVFGMTPPFSTCRRMASLS